MKVTSREWHFFLGCVSKPGAFFRLVVCSGSLPVVIISLSVTYGAVHCYVYTFLVDSCVTCLEIIISLFPQLVDASS